MAADLRHEYGPAGDGREYSTEKSPVVVCKERECERFVPYKVGYSPKEVAERVRDSEIIRIAEGRKVADEERASNYRVEEERRREGFRQEDIARQEGRDRRDRRDRLCLAILSTVLTAVLGGVAAYVGYWFKGHTDKRAAEELRERLELPAGTHR